ncbi:MAG: ABC transporter substrate-binding protein, partial [Acidimicrobiales bacterium]
PGATAPAATAAAPPTADVAYNLGAVASYAVGQQPSNWDIHSAGAAPFYETLEQVLAQVWPSAFELGPTGVPVRNGALLTSARQVSPTKIVYEIDPRAVWSDGIPITYKDFAYNWRAQSGRATWRDRGGKAYTPMGSDGYNDISAVVGGRADPYSVTVTLSHPYPDWRSLFSYLVPAHVAKAVGFDAGFTDPVADLVSGGAYMVSSLQPGYSLELVRNARYWGNPANFASVTYYFTSGPAQVLDALAGGELDVAALRAPPSGYQALQAAGDLSVRAVASSYYEDLDFNEATGPLRDEALRQAVMMAVDRSAMARAVLAPYGLAARPVENRAFMPGSPGYRGDGSAWDGPRPAAALRLLAAHGYKRAKTAPEGAEFLGPGGRPVDLSLYVDSADPWAGGLAAQVASSCAAIGVSVSIERGTSPVGDVTGSDRALAPPAGWEMAIEVRQVPAFASALAGTYASGGSANIDGYSSAAMDALLARVPTTPAGQLPAVFDQVDNQAWQSAADLPLVAVPVVVATNDKLLNLQVGPWPADIAWDEQDWGFEAS